MDSIKVTYRDFNLPDIKRTFTNADKYGQDKSRWPIWLRKKVGLLSFREDTIHLDQLTLNDHFWFSFDSSRSYKTLPVPDSEYATETVKQNDLVFHRIRNEFRFSYFFINKDLENEDVDIIVNGELIDLNSLESVKKHFPNSYDWRDGRMNMLYSGYHPDSTIHFNTLNFLERKTKSYLQFYYYKGKLVYIYSM